jgi:hypothetical protein
MEPDFILGSMENVVLVIFQERERERDREREKSISKHFVRIPVQA